MKAIILAAGYATRMFPLTENFPKPLITVAWKAIMDYVIAKIVHLWINDISIVTNDKYCSHFEIWAKQYNDADFALSILNDHTLSNQDRLWAIGDIQFTIDQKNIDDDVLIVLWDNLFTFTLEEAYSLFKEKARSVIIWYDVKNIEFAKKLWNLTLDWNRLTNFVEKPENPASTLSSSGIYFYPQNVVRLFKYYIDEWNQIQDQIARQKWKDAPGNFLAWLLKKEDVFVKVHDSWWYDIGTFETLKQAKEDFGENDVNIEKLKKGE